MIEQLGSVLKCKKIEQLSNVLKSLKSLQPDD